MKKAKFVKDVSGFTGIAKLYRVSPPVRFNGQKRASWIIVSGVDAMFSGPETYIFPASAKGEVRDWGELEGSFRGSIDHNQALRNAGYEIGVNKIRRLK